MSKSPAPWLVVAILTSAACDPQVTANTPGSTEAVTFPSQGITIAGEITFPTGTAPFPAVVLVHGSGPVTRAGNAPLIEPFLSQGIAVLAYDKRGTGQSGGHYRGVGPLNGDSMIRLLGSDAVAALEALRSDRRIDASRLGMAGGSQAGWIVPNAAARFPVRFSVILSGPLVSVGEEIHYSDAFENSSLGFDRVDSVLATFAGPRGYDPLPDLEHANGAIYWAHGARDRSIPAVKSAAIAQDRIARWNRNTWREILYPTGDHSLFDADTGRPLPVFPPIQEWLRGVLQR